MENMEKGLTVPKWVLVTGSLAKNTPNAPEFICLNLSAQAQKFWIFMKKGFIGRL
jgi:hypothetical protein